MVVRAPKSSTFHLEKKVCLTFFFTSFLKYFSGNSVFKM